MIFRVTGGFLYDFPVTGGYLYAFRVTCGLGSWRLSVCFLG
jgi:hypothetical protein